jgi:hypothetical protein
VRDIQPSLEASVGGVLELSNSGPNRLRATLVLLREPDEDSRQISGVILQVSETGVEPETFNIEVDPTDPTNTVAVCPVEDARYYYQRPNEGGGTDISEISFDELRRLAPTNGTVFGTLEDDGDECFDATLVYAIELASET